MKVIRINENHIQIYPEEQMNIFVDALGWSSKKKLNSIVCELKGYGVDDEN